MTISGADNKPFSTISGRCHVGMEKNEAKTRGQRREFRKTDTNNDGKLTGKEIVARRREEINNMSYEALTYNSLALGVTVITGGAALPVSGILFGAGIGTSGKALYENQKTDEYEKQYKLDENY